MSIAQRVFHGRFGRVALLNMDRSLVIHTHSECHVLIKVSGKDTYFNVNGRRVPLSDRTAVLVNAWEPHFYDPQPGGEATVILALYIEPAWLATAQQSLALSGRPDFFPIPVSSCRVVIAPWPIPWSLKRIAAGSCRKNVWNSFCSTS